MSSPVNLEFFMANTMQKLNIGDFDTLYKNTHNNIIPIVIANTGGRNAIKVKASFKAHQRVDGRLDDISHLWKSLSFDTSATFKNTLELPDILRGKFMPGYRIYSENFNNIIGQSLPQDWDVAGGSWEVYFLTEGNKQNSYLHHLATSHSITTGRAVPMHYPRTRNSETIVDLAVQKFNFGGIMLRLDNDTGYYIIVYPDPATIERINNHYRGIIPNYKGIDPHIEAAIGIGKGKHTDLDNFGNFNIFNRCHWFPEGTGHIGITRDKLRVFLEENVFKIWFNDKPIGTWIDPSPFNNDGRMALISGRRFGSVVIFDDLEHKIQTERGVLYVRSGIPSSPEDSLDRDGVYYSDLLIEYSE